MGKLPLRHKAKCKQCGKKNKPRYEDKSKKGKLVYICRDCCGFKYTEGDKRTIEEKYDKEVLSFIKKQFNRKCMSFPFNPAIINKRRYSREIEIANKSGRGKLKKIKRKLRKKKYLLCMLLALISKNCMVNNPRFIHILLREILMQKEIVLPNYF